MKLPTPALVNAHCSTVSWKELYNNLHLHKKRIQLQHWTDL